jgi:peroxiredoxin
MRHLLLIFIFMTSSFGLLAKEDSTKNINTFLKNNKNVLVHVHATWCPSCKVQKKILDSIESKNYKVLEVDFDSDKTFLKENKVFQQSMLIAFSNGVELNRVFGITKKEKIMDFIKTNFEYSLQGEIDARRSKSKVPSKARMTMEQATEELRQSGIIGKALKKGQKFIDFELPNISGSKVKLSDELKKGPVVLTFYRGGWCPYCNLQLKAYQDHLDEFKKAGGQLIAVSPESMESANTTVKKNDIKFQILTDNLNKEARKYGLVFKLSDELKQVYLKAGLDVQKNQGNNSWEVPIPATYVINTDGEVVYSFLNVDYVKRAEPIDIIESLKSLNK